VKEVGTLSVAGSKMTEDSAIVAITLGGIAIAVYFLTNRFQFGRMTGNPAAKDSGPIPAWLNMLIFVGVGALFVLAALGSLLF
jgi:ABC-type xylose transport system permease subunit